MLLQAAENLMLINSQPEKACRAIDYLVHTVHAQNVTAGWWTDLTTGQPLQRNMGEMLMLVVSELSEAAVGFASNNMDDKLPHRRAFEVEVADALIRILDLAGGVNIELSYVVRELTRWPMRHDPLDAHMGNIGALMVVAVRLSMAMEGHRRGGQHHHYKHIPALDVELGRSVQAILSVAMRFGLDVPGAMIEKLQYNASRADHSREARLAANGKKY